MTDLERDLINAFGWLLYPVPLLPLLFSLVAAWTTAAGVRHHRRREAAAAPTLSFRLGFGYLALVLDLLVVLFCAAFAWAWALWTAMWLAVPATVTAVALFQLQKARTRLPASLEPWP